MECLVKLQRLSVVYLDLAASDGDLLVLTVDYFKNELNVVVKETDTVYKAFAVSTPVIPLVVK